jgi:hypothetical protein
MSVSTVIHTSSRRPRSRPKTSPSKVRQNAPHAHGARSNAPYERRVTRRATGGGQSRFCRRVTLRATGRDVFPTRAPPRTFTQCGLRGADCSFGIVRCRVRTEQNMAPFRSTAAAVTIQTLVVVGLQARSDKGWLVNVSPWRGAPCVSTTTPPSRGPFGSSFA